MTDSKTWSARFDSVVMLTWSNWKTEMRSNRYHYATRFARELPVLFVQADLVGDSVELEPTEVAGITVLHVSSTYGPEQTYQLEKALEDRGIKRPLLWVYNVYFEDFISQSFAPLIVYHATEDWFNTNVLIHPGADVLQRKLRRVLSMSDLVVAVTEGVRESYEVRGNYRGPITVAANGCDFAFWRAAELGSADAAQRSKVAVYQGGLSYKVDFALLEELATSLPDWEFWFAGDEVDELDKWGRVKRLPNVRYHGVLRPNGLRELVHRATVGLIPFVQGDFIVRRSWPLKAFEYVASGLPVVTVPIDTLQQFPEVFTFARNAREFSEALEAVATTRWDPEAVRRRLRVAQGQDYDSRFRHVTGVIAQTRSPHELSRTRLRTSVAATRSRFRRWRSRISTNARASLKLTLVKAIIRDQPALRELLSEYLASEQLRSRIAIGQLLSDLMRLGLVRFARDAEHDDGVLTVSRTAPTGVPELRSIPLRVTRQELPLDITKLDHVRWDYSALGGGSHVVAGRWWPPVLVTLPPGGNYRFTALTSLLPLRKELVLAATKSVAGLTREAPRLSLPIGKPFKTRIAIPIAMPIQVPVATARRYGSALARSYRVPLKGIVAVDAILSTGPLRTILWHWVRNSAQRRDIPLSTLMRDLLKMFIVYEARRGRLRGESFGVTLTAEGDTLVLTSSRAADEQSNLRQWDAVERQLLSGGLTRLVWDHAPVDYRVTYHSRVGLRVGIGGNLGHNRLTALEPFLKGRPDLITDLLRPPRPLRSPSRPQVRHS